MVSLKKPSGCHVRTILEHDCENGLVEIFTVVQSDICHFVDVKYDFALNLDRLAMFAKHLKVVEMNFFFLSDSKRSFFKFGLT